MVIAHGKTESDICRWIRSNLRIPMEIHDRNKGRNSIEITSLMNELESMPFKNFKNFKNKYPKVNTLKKELIEFKIFPIMDIEKCYDSSIIEKYMDGSMFKNHWLANYIMPIYNITKIEDVFKNANLTYAESDKEKRNYNKIFPVNNSGVKDDEVIRICCEELKKADPEKRKSNIQDFFNECLIISETC